RDTLACLQQLSCETTVNFEIVFVNNGGTAAVKQEVKSYIHTYVELKENTGAYLARNVGALFARSSLLIFLDDDALPAENLVHAHIDAHKTYDVVAVRGAVLPKSDKPLNQQAVHYNPGKTPFPVYAEVEGNTSYQAAAFFRAGGWDDAIRFGGGGLDLAIRLSKYYPEKHRQIYSPQPVIFHDYARDEEHLQAKKQRQAKSHKHLIEKHPDYGQFLQSWQDCFFREDLLRKRQNKTNAPVPADIFVSIVIPVYNREKYLTQAINSALDQTYPNFEVVVVDDGSDDGTAGIIHEFNSDKLRYIRKLHSGAPDTRNRGIREARGEYILWLDSDDILLPIALENHIRCLQEYPDAQILYGDLIIFSRESGAQRVLSYPEWHGRTNELISRLLQENCIPNPGTLVKKSCYEKAGVYSTEFPRAHDYEWWSRAAGEFTFKHIGNIVLKWRWHETNMSTGTVPVDFSFDAQVVQNMVRNYSLKTLFPEIQWKKIPRKEAEAIAFLRIAIRLAALKDWAGALAYVDRSDRMFPSRQAERIRNEIQKIRVEELPAEPAKLNKDAVTLPAPAAGKLRITYLINTILHRSGGNQTLLNQANALAERGHQVNIVSYTREKPDWFDIKANLIPVPPGEKMAGYFPPSDAAIATYFTNALELQQIEASAKIYYAQGDQVLFQEKINIKDEKKRTVYRKLQEMSRKSYQLPGIYFIANSHNLARTAEKNYGRAADAVLPVRVDSKLFRPLERPLQGSRWRILIVGPDLRGTELEPLEFKGIQDTLEALKILQERTAHFTAIRMSSTVPEIFSKFPCEFYMAPSEEMKTMLFGTSHILIYASHYDSCPRPPLEAMAGGTAVVCTATPGAMEYCADGENSLLVPIQSPQAIADAVEKLMKDHELRNRLIRGGHVTAREREQQLEYDELEKLLIQFVEKRPAAAAESAANKKDERERETLQLLEKGKILQQEGRFKEAGEIFQDIISRHPELPDARRCHAANLIELENFEEGIAAYFEVLKDFPEDVQALSELAALYQEAQKPAEARTLLKKAVSLSPGNCGLLNELGVLEWQSGRPEQAQSCFEKAAADAGSRPEYIKNLADLYLETEQFDKGVPLLIQLIQKWPGDFESYEKLLNLYVENGDYRKAQLLADDYLKIVPEDAYAREIRDLLQDPPVYVACHLINSGHLEEALELLETFLESSPEHTAALLAKGSILFHHKKYAAALKIYKELLFRDESNSEALYYTGKIFLLTGEITEFEKLAASCKEAFQQDSLLQKLQVEYFMQCGQYDAAGEQIQKWLDADEGDAEIFLWQGMINYHKGSLQEAETSFQMAMQIDPGNEMARENLTFLKQQGTPPSV
ncbi:MAG: glycosyltransferase, partial [Calditrichia bacterium]